MSTPGIAFTALSMAALLAACSDEGKVDQSLESAMLQGVAEVFSPRSHHRLLNVPGMFTATVDGVMGGDHWDASGRRYSPQLMLGCFKRESDVRLRFAVPISSTTPLPARGDLRAMVALDGGAPRTMTLTRVAGMYRIEGALPLVRELLRADRVTLETLTADNLRLSAEFDLRELGEQVSRYDFYCANRWLAAEAPSPQSVPNTGAAVAAQSLRLDDHARLQLERLRAEVRAINGVTSTVWLPDRTLMLGMGNATPARVQTAVREACELMRNYPEVRQQVEVHDTRATTSAVQRLACPQ